MKIKQEKKERDFSFIIPAFNAEKTIERCIESILKVKNKDIEIIIVNDGSVDNTVKILNKYLENSNIILVNQINKGVAAARNAGIECSNGKYLFFIDADDEINSINIEKLMEETIKNKCDWATSSYCIINKNKKNNYIINAEEIDEELNGLEHIIQGYVWGKFYKSEIIKRQQIFFDESLKFAEDMLFNLNYSLYTKKYICIKECCYNYYLNDNSLSRKYCENYLENMKKVEYAFQKIFSKYPKYREIYEKKFGSVKLSIILGYIRNEFRRNSNKNIKDKIVFVKREFLKFDVDNVKFENAIGIYNKLALFVIKTKKILFIVYFFSIINLLKG